MKSFKLTISSKLFIFAMFLAGFLVFAHSSEAATSTWDGGGADENWATAGNWSPEYVPNATDTVIFSGSSTKSVTINQNVTVLGINVQSTYTTGTISQGTSTITITSSSLTIASGTWVGGSGVIDINDSSFSLTGGYFSAPSSTGSTSSLFIERNMTISGGTFSAANATTTFDSNDANDGTKTLSCSETLSGIVVVADSGQLDSDFTLGSGCAVNFGTNPTIKAARNLTINGTLLASGTLTMSNNRADESSYGAVPNLLINGTVNSSGTTWDTNDYNVTASGTIIYSGTEITVERNFTYKGGSGFSGKTVTMDGGTGNRDAFIACVASFPGSLTLNKTNGNATTTLASNCTIQGVFTRTNGSLFGSSSAAVTLSLEGNIITAGNSLRSLGNANLTFAFTGTGTQTASSTGPDFGGPVIINKSGGELQLLNNFTASSTCNIATGTISLLGQDISCGDAITIGPSGIFKLYGSEVVNATSGGVTFNTSSTILFTGDGDSAGDSYTVTNVTSTFSHFTVSSTDSQDSYLIAAPLDINGDFSIATGTLQASTTLNIAGNWTNTSSTFTAGTSTVIFDGAGTSTITGTSTFANLKGVTAGATLQFGAGQTFTVSDTLTLTGASGNSVFLRSSTDGTAWLINPTTASASFVDVKDSNNTNSTAISCTNGCTDSGGNTKWTFVATASTGGGGGGSSAPSPSASGGAFSVTINGGAVETTDEIVSLKFVGGNDSYYVDFGENSSFSAGSYRRELHSGDKVHAYTFSPPYTDTHSTSSGQAKTIYARFWTQSLTQPSNVFSDSIVVKISGVLQSTSSVGTSAPLPTSTTPLVPPTDLTPRINTITSFMFLESRGEDVVRLQSFLRTDPSLYPKGFITGYYGSLTLLAVQKFQCRYRIICSHLEGPGYGRVGPATLQKLNEIISAIPLVPASKEKPGSAPVVITPSPSVANTAVIEEQIRQIQIQLTNLLNQLIQKLKEKGN